MCLFPESPRPPGECSRACGGWSELAALRALIGDRDPQRLGIDREDLEAREGSGGQER